MELEDLVFYQCIGDTINLNSVSYDGVYLSLLDSILIQDWTFSVEQDTFIVLTGENACYSDSFNISIYVSELDLGSELSFYFGDL